MVREATAMQRTESCPTVIRHDLAKPYRYAFEAIPRYAGYIPAKYPETVYAGTMHRMNKHCRSERLKGISTTKVRGESEPPPPQTRHPPWDRRNVVHPFAGDYKESAIVTPRRREATVGAQTFQTGNIPRYAGFVPGKMSENVYGETWQRTLEASNRAFDKTYDGPNRLERNDPFHDRSRRKPRNFYDMAQNKNLRCMMTHDATVVARMDSDHLKERPIFNPAYNDIVNGWSGCPYTGKHIDPAGRKAPFSKQESHKQIRPIPPNYRIGVHGEPEICGERRIKVNEIAHIHTQKNRVNILQT